MGQLHALTGDVPGTLAGQGLDGIRAFDLQVATDANLPDNAHAISEAELLLDALSSYHTKLIGDMRDVSTWLEGEEADQQALNRYITEGEFLADLSNLNRLAQHMDLIGGHCGSELRQIYQANPQAGQP